MKNLNLLKIKDAKHFAFCGLLQNKKKETLNQLLKVYSNDLSKIENIVNTITNTFETDDQKQKFNSAINLSLSKKFSKARSILENLQKEDPYQLPVLFELLKIYEILNLHKKIIPFHSELDHLNPFHAPIHFLVARSALKLDELKVVMEQIAPFESIPQSKSEWVNLQSQALFRNGNQMDAIELLKNFNQKNSALNLLLANMLITTRKDLPQAKELLDLECSKTPLDDNIKIECKQLTGILRNLKSS